MFEIAFEFENSAPLRGIASNGPTIPGALPELLKDTPSPCPGIYAIENTSTRRKNQTQHNIYCGIGLDIPSRFTPRIAAVNELGLLPENLSSIYVSWGKVFIREIKFPDFLNEDEKIKIIKDTANIRCTGESFPANKQSERLNKESETLRDKLADSLKKFIDNNIKPTSLFLTLACCLMANHSQKQSFSKILNTLVKPIYKNVFSDDEFNGCIAMTLSDRKDKNHPYFFEKAREFIENKFKSSKIHKDKKLPTYTAEELNHLSLHAKDFIGNCSTSFFNGLEYHTPSGLEKIITKFNKKKSDSLYLFTAAVTGLLNLDSITVEDWTEQPPSRDATGNTQILFDIGGDGQEETLDLEAVMIGFGMRHLLAIEGAPDIATTTNKQKTKTMKNLSGVPIAVTWSQPELTDDGEGGKYDAFASTILWKIDHEF